MARSAGQTVGINDRTRYISTAAVALGAMALVTTRGPIAEARRVDTPDEFEAIYGPAPSDTSAWHEAKHSLEKGCALLISRVVHFTDLTDPATKTSARASVTVADRSSVPGRARATGTGTFPKRLAHGQTLVVSVTGGGDQVVTFNAYAMRVTGVGGTFATVTAGDNLTLLVGGVKRTVAFAGTESDAADFAAAINEGLPGVWASVVGGQVRVTTDAKGTAASLAVHADTSASVLTSLGLTVGAGTAAGVSNVADIEAVTAAEFEGLVETAVTGVAAGASAAGAPYIETTATGSGVSVQVKVASTAVAFGFDNTVHAGVAGSGVDTLALDASSDGTWAHGTRYVISDASISQATRWAVKVTDASGRLLDGPFDELSMDPTDARYFVTVLSEESRLVRGRDLASATAAPANRPANGTYTPSGGADGLAGLDYNDFIGARETRTGFYAFNGESDFRLVSAPDQTSHEMHVAGAAWARALTEVQYVGAVPFSITSTDGLKAFSRRTAPFATGAAINSEYATLYALHHRVRDPATRRQRWVSGIGDVYAALAAATKAGGPWLALAGENHAMLLRDVLEVRVPVDLDTYRSVLAAGVNVPLKNSTGSYYIEGQVTLKRDPSALQRVNVRLLTDFISEQARNGMQIQRYEPNDETLWTTLREKGKRFMEALAAKRGTFEVNERGEPRMRVVCDRSNNTPDTIRDRKTVITFAYVAQETSEEQVINLDLYTSGTPV